MENIRYLWIVTDLETGNSLEADGYGDEWESGSENEDEIRERAATFHSLPFARISAYVYTTTRG